MRYLIPAGASRSRASSSQTVLFRTAKLGAPKKRGAGARARTIPATAMDARGIVDARGVGCVGGICGILSRRGHRDRSLRAPKNGAFPYPHSSRRCKSGEQQRARDLNHQPQLKRAALSMPAGWVEWVVFGPGVEIKRRPLYLARIDNAARVHRGCLFDPRSRSCAPLLQRDAHCGTGKLNCELEAPDRDVLAGALRLRASSSQSAPGCNGKFRTYPLSQHKDPIDEAIAV